MYIIKPVGFSLQSISEAENDAQLWNANATYSVGNWVMRDGKLYVSSISGNTGLDPLEEVQELEGARWIYVSATNIRRFFDQSLSTATEGASPLVIEVQAEAAFNALAIFGLRCSETVVELVKPGSTHEVARITSGPEPVNNWWSWLHTVFSPVTRRAVVPGIGGLAGDVVRLTLIGEAPALGELVIGRSIRIGTTLLKRSTSVRRRTFTSIETNAFGVTTATKRAIARDVTYAVRAKRQGFSAVERFLDDVDGVRVVAYGHPDWPQLISYGYVTDYEIPAALPDDFFFDITVQGVS